MVCRVNKNNKNFLSPQPQSSNLRLFKVKDMKIYLILIASLIVTRPAAADVQFIVKKGESYNGARTLEGYESIHKAAPATESNSCENEGYKILTCEEGFYPVTPCPYNPYYYKECCPEEYKYTPQECYDQKKSPSTYNCGGYYACY